MNDEPNIFELESKPKIYRVPFVSPVASEDKIKKNWRLILYIALAIAVIASIFIGFAFWGGQKSVVSVVPQSPSPQTDAEKAETDDLISLIGANSDQQNDDFDMDFKSNLYFKDHEEMIVGQTDKNTPEFKKFIDKPTSNNNENPANHSLLDIISKY